MWIDSWDSESSQIFNAEMLHIVPLTTEYNKKKHKQTASIHSHEPQRHKHAPKQMHQQLTCNMKQSYKEKSL